MSTPTTPRDEFQALIAQALKSGDPPAAIAKLAYDVRDEWQEVDVSTFGQGPRSEFVINRWLVVRIPRQGISKRADRTVTE